MMGNLEEILHRLSKDHTLMNSVEEATKQGAVLPVLSSLGWDCFNIEEVTPEFSVGNGRVDYCLKANNKNMVFIEVKRATEELERHEKQLLEYSFAYGVGITILTNGLIWYFYLPLHEGDWQQRKFISIDIRQQEVATSMNYFNDFLSKESILNGSAVKKAKELKKSKEKNKLIEKTIPVAWRKLIEEPDEMLLELFAEKIESLCGHSPDLEALTEFVKIQYNAQPTLPQRPPIRPTITRGNNAHPDFPDRPSRQRGISVTIGDKTIVASTVADLYFQALQYLYDNNYILKIEDQIPYATSSRRFLIAKEPFHQEGNSFRCPIEYKSYFMEAHKNYESALKQLEDFVKKCGLTMKY